MFNPIFKENVHERKHPGSCAFAEPSHFCKESLKWNVDYYMMHLRNNACIVLTDNLDFSKFLFITKLTIYYC